MGSLTKKSPEFNPEIRPFPGGAQEWKWSATVSEGPVAAASQVRGRRNNSDDAQIQTCCGWALPQPRSGQRASAPAAAMSEEVCRNLPTLSPCRGGCGRGRPRSGQSQRDCVLQPKVARHELPWGHGRMKSPPRMGCDRHRGLGATLVGVLAFFLPMTQGSLFASTCRRNPQPVGAEQKPTRPLRACAHAKDHLAVSRHRREFIIARAKSAPGKAGRKRSPGPDLSPTIARWC